MSFAEWWSESRRKGEGWQGIPLSAEQRAALADLVDKYTADITFGPREIAGLTPAETAMEKIAGQVVSEGAPGVSDAMKVLKERMTGPVEQVPGLEGLFTKVRESGANLLGSTKRGLALTGNLPTESSTGEKVYGRTLQDIMEGLVTAAYPYYAQSLAGKQAAPMQLASMGTQDVATRAAAAAGPGAASRNIEQQILDAIFEALRRTQEFPYQVQAPIAQSILNQQMYAYDPGILSPSRAAIFTSGSPMGGGGASGGQSSSLQYNPQQGGNYYQGYRGGSAADSAAWRNYYGN